MKVGSLFAGIGGFDLGFERAGMSTVWMVENEPFCQFVLQKRFPHAERHNDVSRVSNLEPVEVLCGGFPCQDISIGNRNAEGLDGARSGQWRHFARLIGELSPKYVVIENSPILRTRGLQTVLEDLAALGYDAEWHCLTAEAFGANHIRKRIFIVAYPNRIGPWGSRGESRLLTPSEWSKWESETREHNWWTIEPEPSRVDVGFPYRMDKDWRPRVRATGNALVPQIAEFIGTCIMRDHDETQYCNTEPALHD